MYQSLLCPECGCLNMTRSTNPKCFSCGAKLAQEAVRPAAKKQAKAPRPVLVMTLSVVATIGLMLAFAGTKRYQRGPVSSPVAYDWLAPEVRLTADNLNYVYETNEVRADELYKGKVVEVSGAVGRVSKGVFNTLRVSLAGAGGGEKARVDCYFDEKNSRALADLKPGQIVFIRGTCDGMAGDVVLKDCAIKIDQSH